jgi:hypothetical protein
VWPVAVPAPCFHYDFTTVCSKQEGMIQSGRPGTGGWGSLFTSFCFSVASTFAKMGLLTFRGGKHELCVAVLGRQRRRTCGQPQGSGLLGSISQHRACPRAGLHPAPHPLPACLVGGRGCQQMGPLNSSSRCMSWAQASAVSKPLLRATAVPT